MPRREIAFEGIDGTGKTTVINKISHRLEGEGVVVATAAPFARANELLGTDTYDLWTDPVQRHIALRAVKQATREARADADSIGADVLLWDRHWMTLWCDIEHAACLKLEWQGDFVPVALLRTEPETAHQRIGETEEPWATLQELGRYAAAYNRLAFQFPHLLHGIYRSDDDVSPDAIARAAIWDMGARR
ncbi:hypothetical protein EOL96_01115 [Candidatus Saccharibacteria bacterium]|nr:hypothetical protein [Candidatus Saccharibacteria bacterium]